MITKYRKNNSPAALTLGEAVPHLGRSLYKPAGVKKRKKKKNTTASLCPIQALYSVS